jgi:hypothetical protein
MLPFTPPTLWLHYCGVLDAVPPCEHAHYCRLCRARLDFWLLVDLGFKVWTAKAIVRAFYDDIGN